MEACLIVSLVNNFDILSSFGYFRIFDISLFHIHQEGTKKLIIVSKFRLNLEKHFFGLSPDLQKAVTQMF